MALASAVQMLSEEAAINVLTDSLTSLIVNPVAVTCEGQLWKFAIKKMK